jgi:hypothetical protein
MTYLHIGRIKNYAYAVLIFLLAFIPRYAGLGKIIVADEQLWIGRSVKFFRSLLDLDLQGTSITGHPGVMTMWLCGFSMGLKNWLDGSASVGDLLFAGQFPIALVTSISVVIMYLLVRKLFDEMTAIVAAILIGTDPFFLPLSRAIHLDALATCFMTLAALFFIVFLKESKHRYLILSLLCTGLGVLTKVPAVFLFGFMGFILLIEFIRVSLDDRKKAIASAKEYLKTYIIWFFISLLVILVFWPAIWSDPMVFIRLFTKGPGLVAHEGGQFFWGHPVRDPGFLYYAVVILFKTTPITLVFSILSVVMVIWTGVSNHKSLNSDWFYTLFIICYVILFTFFMSVPLKKIGRYILPVFPMLNILASIGITRFVKAVADASTNRKRLHHYAFWIAVVTILVVQIYPLVKLHPYELSYFNPIAGGASKAKDVLLVGQGEGLDLVGKYLNEKENAQDLIVVSDFDYLLKQYFKGEVKSLKVEQYETGTIENVDYLVIYISGLQRGHLRLPLEVIEYHRNHTPEHVVVINGIEYAYIYKMDREK